MAAKIMSRVNPSVTLTVLATALLVGGFSQLGVAQDSDTAQPAKPKEPPCDFDVSADCRLLMMRGTEESKTPKETAPIDMTGYWMSVITEDWRWRALTPPKGDYASLPLNQEGMRVSDTWDPNDVGSCKPFGAAALLRNPTRVQFEWEDDTTLILKTDNGEQTRTFQFGATTPGPDHPHSLQGFSVASWHLSGLKVETTHLTAGYLRKNGVPYSADARVTEYYDMYTAFDDTWLTVTTIVEDPRYLTRTFNTSLDFKKLKNGSDWTPTPCGVTEDS